MCNMFHFDTGNEILDNDSAMDLKKSSILFLFFNYLILIISVLVSATPRKSNKLLKNKLEVCPCFELQSYLMKIPQILDPKSKGIDRLVIYAYRTSNGIIYTYIPNMDKQSLFPDLQYEPSDSFDIKAHESLETIFTNYYKIHRLGLIRKDLDGEETEKNKQPKHKTKNIHRFIEQYVAIPEDYEPDNTRPGDGRSVKEDDSTNERKIDKHNFDKPRRRLNEPIQEVIVEAEFDLPIQNENKILSKGIKQPAYIQAESQDIVPPLFILPEYDEVKDKTSEAFDNKFQPVDPLKKESELLNIFLIDDDIIKDRPVTNSGRNFSPDSSKRRMPFDIWFIKQMKNMELGKSNKKPRDYKAIQNFVQAALKRNGMVVSQKGDLKDSQGNSLNLANINLRRLLIGDLLGYNRDNLDGIFRVPKKASYYMESLLIAQKDPLKIIGIIPLGKTIVQNTLGFSHSLKQNNVHHLGTTRTFGVKDSASIVNVEPNKVLRANKRYGLKIGKPVKYLLNNLIKSKVLDTLRIKLDDSTKRINGNSQETNDSVPIAKSEFGNVANADEKVKNYLSILKTTNKVHDSSQEPTQSIVSLLQSFVGQHKNKNTSVKTSKEPEELDISKNDKILDGDTIQYSSGSFLERPELITQNDEVETNNTLAQDIQIQKEEAKADDNVSQRVETKPNNSLFTQLFGNLGMKGSTVGGAEIVDDMNPDVRIIGGLAATGSGAPISNRGRRHI